MNKGQVIGLAVLGLVVVGAVTVVQFLKKPRKNSEGFFNASGFAPATSNFAKANLKTCKRLDGTYYSEQQGRPCINGAREVAIR